MLAAPGVEVAVGFCFFFCFFCCSFADVVVVPLAPADVVGLAVLEGTVSAPSVRSGDPPLVTSTVARPATRMACDGLRSSANPPWRVRSKWSETRHRSSPTSAP